MSLLDDWVYTTQYWNPSESSAKDQCSGCDATFATNQKYHGVVPHKEGMLHINPQHHSGRGRPNTSPQEFATHSRTKTGQFYSLGTSKHSSCIISPVSICQ